MRFAVLLLAAWVCVWKVREPLVSSWSCGWFMFGLHRGMDSYFHLLLSTHFLLDRVVTPRYLYFWCFLQRPIFMTMNHDQKLHARACASSHRQRCLILSRKEAHNYKDQIITRKKRLQFRLLVFFPCVLEGRKYAWITLCRFSIANVQRPVYCGTILEKGTNGLLPRTMMWWSYHFWTNCLISFV